MCGCLLPSKPGSTCSLRDRICQSFNLYKVLFQSQPAEDGQVTPSTGVLCAHGGCLVESREPGEEKDQSRPRKGGALGDKSGKRLIELVLL